MMLLAMAALAAGNPQQERDLRCLASMLYVTGTVDAVQRQKVVMGAMYYVGRIEGRDPEIDLEREMRRLLADQKAFAGGLKTELQRCSTELEATGGKLGAMGRSLKSAAPK